MEKSELIQSVITYLNERTGSRYRAGSDNAKKHLSARIDEGRTLEDFRLVIDDRVAAWLNNPPWDTYLRPRTMFGTKFDGYLENARRKQKKQFQQGTHFRNAEELLK
jgi:uncharacterized phage protein (TIGR02220 family)